MKLDLFEISLGAAMFLVPLVFMEISIGYMNFSIIEVAFIFIAIGFLFRVKSKDIKLYLSWADKIFLLLILTLGISLFRSIDLGKSLREFIWWVEAGIIFYMIEHGATRNQIAKKVIKAGTYGAFVTSVLAILLFINELQAGNAGIHISGTLLNANFLSGYLIIFIPLAIGLSYTQKNKLFWVCVATGIITALVTTYTRGGWYAIVIAVSLMAGLLRNRNLMIMLVVYIVLYSVFFPGVGARAASGFDSETNTGVERIQLWQVGLKMAQEHPIVGVGIGNYVYLYDDYVRKYPEIDRGCPVFEPHNSFVKILAENGLIALTLFLTFLLALVKEVYLNILKLKGTPTHPLIVGMTCGLVAFLLQSNTNSLFQVPRVAFSAWIIFAVVKEYAMVPITLGDSSLPDRPAGLGVNHILNNSGGC